MSKTVKKLAGIAAPFAGFIPGIGPLAAAGLGAAGGLLSGGGLKGALLGGLSGGLTGGASGMTGADQLLKGSGLASGLSSAATKGLVTGLQGAAIGGSQGGLKGALLGAGLGGLGSYAMGGGLNGLGLGDAASNIPKSGVGPFNPGSGILGSVTKGVSDIGSALSGAGTGAGGSSFNLAGTALGALNSGMANEQAEDDLLESQRKALEGLSPYLQNGQASNARLSELLGLSGDPNAEGYGSLGKKFSAEDFQTDPGYQFSLEQGQQALDRSQAARGKYFSGQALKDAATFSQGLADQAYNDSYNRWRQDQTDMYNRYALQSNSGLGAAGAAGDIYGNIGSTKANAGIANANIGNSVLSSLFGGGAYQRDAAGNIVYDQDQLLQQLLNRRGA